MLLPLEQRGEPGPNEHVAPSLCSGPAGGRGDGGCALLGSTTGTLRAAGATGRVCSAVRETWALIPAPSDPNDLGRGPDPRLRFLICKMGLMLPGPHGPDEREPLRTMIRAGTTESMVPRPPEGQSHQQSTGVLGSGTSPRELMPNIGPEVFLLFFLQQEIFPGKSSGDGCLGNRYGPGGTLPGSSLATASSHASWAQPIRHDRRLGLESA